MKVWHPSSAFKVLFFKQQQKKVLHLRKLGCYHHTYQNTKLKKIPIKKKEKRKKAGLQPSIQLLIAVVVTRVHLKPYVLVICSENTFGTLAAIENPLKIQTGTLLSENQQKPSPLERNKELCKSTI